MAVAVEERGRQHLWRDSSTHGSSRQMQIKQRTIGQAQEARLLLARAREHERRGAAEEALVAYDMVAGLIDGSPPGKFHADLYRWKGTLLRDMGETEKAAALFRRSLDVSHYVLYATGVAHAQNCLATLHQRRGDMCTARQLYSDASFNASAAGDQRIRALVEENLGTLAMAQGDLEGARIRLYMSLRTFRAIGDDDGVTRALCDIGLLHIHHERYEEAAEAFEQAAELSRARGDQVMDGQIALGRASLLTATGHLDEAAAECGRAMTLAERRSERPRKAEALIRLARIQRERGELESAIASLEDAQALARRCEDARTIATSLVDLGETWLQRSQPQRAYRAWRQALVTFTKIGASLDVGRVERRLSTLGGGEFLG